MLTDGAYVTFRHSTRYKNKTAYCPKNGVTGAVIDLAQSEGSLNGCGTFELIGNGKLRILTQDSPKKTSPDYAIVAKNTSVLEDAALSIVCGNSHRDVSSLIQTISLTIDIIPYYPDCQQSSFGPTWHTVIDDMQHIDRNTLMGVGQVMVQVIFSEK